MEMVSLAEFNILCNAQQDIHELPWTQHANRCAMNLHFEIKCTKEEIEQLNVKMLQLFMVIIDEHADFFLAVQASYLMSSDLACELSTQWIYHNCVNEHITKQLYYTASLPGCTAHLVYGTCKGHAMCCTLVNKVPLL